MDKVSGYVERIVYRNEENGYSVLELTGTDAVTVVGILPMISAGEYVSVTGSYSEHPVYGRQFTAESYEVSMPDNASAIEIYLASAIKGVGPRMAAAIVHKFGADTLRVIEEEPERLVKVRGISERGALEIASQVAEKKDLRQAVMFLQGYGISLNLAVRIYQTYGTEIYTILQEDPYRLAEGVRGIGFKMADDIARKVGIRADSDFRIRSGIQYVLQEALGEGHVYLPLSVLQRRTAALLEVEPSPLREQLQDLTVQKRLVMRALPAPEAPREIEDERRLEDYYEESLQLEEDRMAVYSSGAYYTELSVARRLWDLKEAFPDGAEPADGDPDAEIAEIRSAASAADGAGHPAAGRKTVGAGAAAGQAIELDPMQAKALAVAQRAGVTVITGGPGTGKTTTIRSLIAQFEAQGLEIVLAAPTGRAAKRMTEATGREARTIHRLLEVSGGPGMQDRPAFARNEDNPLEADVCIVDEMSMVDMYLMHALLKALPVGIRLILVGDENQLPSVGPGNVLKDIVSSGVFPVVELTRIFRQEEAGDIVTNAHRIREGQEVDLAKKSRDFLFIRRPDASAVLAASLTLLREKLPPYVKAAPEEIQILTPMRKGPLGVESLNAALQERLNPPARDKRERRSGDQLLREGDKVMQIRNDYQLTWEVRGKYGIPIETGTGVYNGDIGVIREIDPFTETMTVEFDDRRQVTYPFSQTDDLELAYAITIHKAQGSEYPAVILPLLSGPRMLMTRNLLYTAVTRARKCVCLVGSAETFYSMAANTIEQKRFSGLCLRLQELEQGI